METLGFNSPSLNPENVLPQWQQKIANAENIYSFISNICGRMDFPHEVRFFAGIEPAHFPAVGTAIDACAAAIFTYFYIPYLFAKCNWNMGTSLEITLWTAYPLRTSRSLHTPRR